MAKKQWGTTYDEEILKQFQATCEEYGMKANTVLEALMKYFNEGKCKLIIDKSGISITVDKYTLAPTHWDGPLSMNRRTNIR